MDEGAKVKPVSTAIPFYGYLAVAQHGADVDFELRNGIVGQHRAFWPFYLSWVSVIFQLRELALFTNPWFVRITLPEGNRKLTSLVAPQRWSRNWGSTSWVLMTCPFKSHVLFLPRARGTHLKSYPPMPTEPSTAWRETCRVQSTWELSPETQQMPEVKMISSFSIFTAPI